jgi:hypothetical protein
MRSVRRASGLVQTPQHLVIPVSAFSGRISKTLRDLQGPTAVAASGDLLRQKHATVRNKIEGRAGVRKGPGWVHHRFSSWTVTEARVCSHSKRISQVLPCCTNEIVKFSSVDGSFDRVNGTRTRSEACPG